ncbi:MAG: hypothetical protein ACT4P6_21185 [Gemmatimonadaceae bacterium]
MAFLLPFVALAARHWRWDPPTGSGDYAQYLSHARALVEGKSYTDIGYIYHPSAAMVGPRAYPPGLPLTLTPIVAFAGVSSPLNRFLMLVTVLAFAYLAYRRLAMAIAPWKSAIAVGFSALAVESRFGTLMPLSDVGLCALMWATVLAIDNTTVWTWRRVALVTALGFAAMAYRVAGVALVPALALYALLTWSRHRGRALYPALIWGAAGLTAVLSQRIELPFATMIVPRIAELSNRMGQVFIVYPLGALAAQLYPFPGDMPNDIYHVLASILMVVGTAALLWRQRRTMLTALAIMYSGLLIASPAIIDRYLWPLLPVLAAGFVVGVSAVWRVVAVRIGRPLGGPILTVATFALIAIGSLIREIQVPPPPSEHHQPARLALFAWLRETSQREPIRVVYSNPRVLTLETRVPAMPAIFATPPQHLAAMYDRLITHLIWPKTPPNECRARLAHDLPALYPDRFKLEYQNPQYLVYRLIRLPGEIPPVPDYRQTWGTGGCDPNRLDRDPERRR